jgi:diguanylate cyclase (GGDEF)-like protein/PAS domain S-box-containing protein
MSVDPKAILQRIESTYGPLAEGVPSVAYVYEPGINGQCLYISPSIERVLGYPQETWIEVGGLWDRLLHPEDAERVISNEAECASSGEALVQEYRISRADGRVVWIRDEMTVVRGGNGQESPLFYGVFLDVTDRKRMEAELERLALYDSLTGLPNRALFSDRLGHAIDRRGRSQATAVYFLDLDRFKRINDSLGHGAGDEVLREVAGRIQRTIRPEDTVARFGGDEFTVLCESVGGVLEAVGVADRLQRELAEPVRAGGAELRLSASIGIAMAEPGDEVEATRLVEDADAAMYRAKERGGARTELFDMAMRERAVEELAIEQELQQGLGRGELRLFYQPLVNLESGEMVGAEALIRWEHPDRGLLSPDKFLPVAEESGLIVEVGAWAVGEACRRLRDWDRRNNGDGSSFSLAVNLSARELTHPDVVPTVLNAVRRAALDPHRLTIEVTESTAMADRETGFRALRELSQAGVRIAIDDFGTGYASLDHLREMPADILKIDRSFVAGMTANSPDSALVAAAIAMGRALEMEVVAEGIETSEQVADLRELGCPLGQGFLFARPLPPDELDGLLGADVQF